MMTTVSTPQPAAVPVTPVAATDADRAVAVLTLAFASDPAARWAYPEGAQYLTYWPAFIRAFGGGAFAAGSAFRAADAGAALWLPPGTGPDEEALGALIEESIAPDARDEVFAVVEEQAAYHPHEPHWYLPLLGVDPARQGNGYGSALLAHVLRRCDREQLPAFLEATSPSNRRLYERHGFRVLGVIQVGASPPIWPMLRRPLPARPSAPAPNVSPA